MSDYDKSREAMEYVARKFPELFAEFMPSKEQVRSAFDVYGNVSPVKNKPRKRRTRPVKNPGYYRVDMKQDDSLRDSLADARRIRNQKLRAFGRLTHARPHPPPKRKKTSAPGSEAQRTDR